MDLVRSRTVLRQAQTLVRPRLAGAALLVLAVATAPAAIGAGSPGRSDQARTLRARDRALAAQSRAAVLGLYALETKLAGARAHLAAVEERAAAVRREREVVGVELAAARASVRVSERRLGDRLRALYEEGGIDPLAIVLGSQSLDAALTGIESLGQIVRGDRRVLADVRAARASLAVIRRRLVARQHRLDELTRSAAETARSLEAARSGRVAYVASLETKRRLNRAEIARLSAAARAAEAKAETLSAAPQPAGDLPAAEPVAAAPEPAAVGSPREEADTGEADGRALTVVATGYALRGRTATGLPVGWGVAAVDPSVIPLGTKLTVPGYGEAVAADVGGAVRGATIDLWFPSTGQAHAWGRRTVTVTLR